MKHLSCLLLFVTNCKNFKIVKIHFESKLVLVFSFFSFQIQDDYSKFLESC